MTQTLTLNKDNCRSTRLTIESEFVKTNASNRKVIYANCLCECGNRKAIMKSHVVAGRVKSCGCLIRDTNRANKTKHGKAGTKFYKHWIAMKNRCNTDERYKNVLVCERWGTFENFYNDMHEEYTNHVKKHGERNTTLDRIDGLKGYSPENCRWATYEVQANNINTVQKYEVNGEMLTPREISKKYKLNLWTIHSRIRKNSPLVKESEMG